MMKPPDLPAHVTLGGRVPSARRQDIDIAPQHVPRGGTTFGSTLAWPEHVRSGSL